MTATLDSPTLPFAPILEAEKRQSLMQAVQFDAQGLVPVIAQDYQTKEVLMFAFMNAESFDLSLQTGFAVYWSRSRQKLWKKGEESGHMQKIYQVALDCDADVLLLQIEQVGGIACHTGRASCFYQVLESESRRWQIATPILKDPSHIYTQAK